MVLRLDADHIADSHKLVGLSNSDFVGINEMVRLVKVLPHPIWVSSVVKYLPVRLALEDSNAIEESLVECA